MHPKPPAATPPHMMDGNRRGTQYRDPVSLVGGCWVLLLLLLLAVSSSSFLCRSITPLTAYSLRPDSPCTPRGLEAREGWWRYGAPTLAPSPS